jgi:hypothetical protein
MWIILFMRAELLPGDVVIIAVADWTVFEWSIRH